MRYTLGGNIIAGIVTVLGTLLAIATLEEFTRELVGIAVTCGAAWFLGRAVDAFVTRNEESA